MSKVETLDTLIRQRARAELQERVHKLRGQLCCLNGPIPDSAKLTLKAGLFWIRIRTDEVGSPVEIQMNLSQLLIAVEKAVVDAFAPIVEQRAVEEFLMKVDGIAQEVADLRSEVQS
jgi:hypothetical protein